jgi:hypothetical protein
MELRNRFHKNSTRRTEGNPSEKLISTGIRGADRRDKLVGFLNGIVDTFGESGDVGVDLSRSTFQRADGAGVEIVL